MPLHSTSEKKVSTGERHLWPNCFVEDQLDLHLTLNAWDLVNSTIVSLDGS